VTDADPIVGQFFPRWAPFLLKPPADMKIRPASLLLLTLPSTVLALGFRITDHGAEATARAGAFTATADNPSAIYYNPAGITQFDGLRVMQNYYTIDIESSFDPSNPGDSLDSKYGWQFVGDLFLTWKPKDTPIALGLGIYSPFGFSMEYSDDALFRTAGIKGGIQFLTANPVLAFQLTDQLSLAVGATVNYSRSKLVQGIITPGDAFQVEGDGVGVGFTAGLLWQPSKRHSFGLRYFGPVDVKYSGHARTRVPGFTTQFEVAPGVSVPVDVPRFENEEDFDLKVNFPQTIAFGYSFRPTEDWNIELGIEWTDWDRLNEPALNLSESPDTKLAFNYKSSFMYQLGITKAFANGWRASAGYVYSENSVPNENFSPLVPDSNRHVVSAGVGRRYDQWDWFLTYQYGYSPSRDIEQNNSVDGSYRLQFHAVTFSVGYRF
jgi:long-chain fatty acid transport protein